MLRFDRLRAAVATLRPAVVDFARRLVQTPSLPGDERKIAGLIQAEMQRLGYDEVVRDEAGNVIGQLRGGGGPALMLNGHMDHVDPGDPAGWPDARQPFGGAIVDGALWGRGAVDMKGPLAAMVYAPAVLKSAGLSPPGDLYTTAVVMEEVGGLGASFLTSHLRAGVAIVGEPSHNTLRRGHRGRVVVEVRFLGHSAHASVPHLAVNPHYQAARFLSFLPDQDMAADPLFGASTVAPTLYRTDQKSDNVIPGEVCLTLDWRNVPAESPAEIVARIEGWLRACFEADAGAVKYDVRVSRERLKTYSGYEADFEAIYHSFVMPVGAPPLQHAQEILTAALGRDVPVDIWRFATDGGHLMKAGIPTLGFGPGDETLAHTNREHLRLAELEEAVLAYAALALKLGEVAT